MGSCNNEYNYKPLSENPESGSEEEEFTSDKLQLVDRGEILTDIYEPNNYSSAEYPTSYFETIVNLFKAVVGTGIFSLPIGFSQVGYALGSVSFIFLTYISVYCGYILAEIQHELCRRRHRPAMNFQETAEAAFQDGPVFCRSLAPIARSVVKILINILTFGSACVYNVVITSNIKQVLDPWLGESDIKWYMLFMSGPLICVNLVRNLKQITPLSGISNVIILSTVLWVFYYVFKDLPSLSQRQAFGSISLLPQFAGTVFFANSCTTLILPLKNEMKRPELFAKQPFGVLTVGSVVIGLLYWVFGVFGYIKYGSRVHESITLDLPHHDIGSALIQAGLALATLAATPLNFYVLFEIMDEDLVADRCPHIKVFAMYTLRVVVVLLSVLVACLVPDMNMLMSLLGGGANCFLSMFLPSVLHLITFPLQSCGSRAINYFIIVLSLVLTITGSTLDITNIIKLYM